MTSPNRLKIWKLFDEAHTTQSLWIDASYRFAEVFKAMKWEWIDMYSGREYIPNRSHIYQTIKDLLIDLKIMIDKLPGPIRRDETFFLGTGRIMCRIYYMDGSWHLSVNLEVTGSEFVA